MTTLVERVHKAERKANRHGINLSRQIKSTLKAHRYQIFKCLKRKTEFQCVCDTGLESAQDPEIPDLLVLETS